MCKARDRGLNFSLKEPGTKHYDSENSSLNKTECVTKQKLLKMLTQLCSYQMAKCES